MKGDDVKAVHKALREAGLGVSTEKDDNIYGAATAQAVRLFQCSKGLIATGKVDGETALALGGPWKAPE